MKKSKFSEEQVLGILKEVERGKSVAEVSRHYGITEQTFYRWRNKYGGLSVSEMKRLRHLESENSQLKRIVAQQLLDNEALKALLAKKW
jgi:putative transposase